MRWLSLLSAKWLRRWTLRLGIVAFIVMAVPALTVFAMISIIGIPLALAMLATPPLFVWFAVASLVQRLHGRDGPAAIVASLALAVLALAGVSAFANAYLDHRADSFLTGDIDTLQRPLRVESVGLVGLGAPGWSKGITRCEDLCQRLMLSGAVARVVVADLKFDETEWTAQSPALAYRFEERASCPPIQLLDRQPSRIDDAKPAEAMRLAVAGGRCLIEEPATLAEAEAVITTGRIQRGVNDFGAGLSLLADTVTADRAAVHLREAGSFVQRYR